MVPEWKVREMKKEELVDLVLKLQSLQDQNMELKIKLEEKEIALAQAKRAVQMYKNRSGR